MLSEVLSETGTCNSVKEQSRTCCCLYCAPNVFRGHGNSEGWQNLAARLPEVPERKCCSGIWAGHVHTGNGLTANFSGMLAAAVMVMVMVMVRCEVIGDGGDDGDGDGDGVMVMAMVMEMMMMVMLLLMQRMTMMMVMVHRWCW